MIRLAVGAFFAFGIFLAGAFAYYAKDLPSPDRLLDRNVAQSTRIYARDGKTLLYEIHGDERRTVTNIKDIPAALKEATVAIEDKNFYQHRGFSITGFLRALWINVISGGKRRPGGSTITQQFVKNAILTNEKTVTRKLKELVLSFELERKFSKDQILQLYLNEIGYGSNNYGVTAAARSFFGKNVQDLTVAESAVLAALPQAPTYYSPYGNHQEALSARHHHILDLMAERGYITPEEAKTAKAEQIVFQKSREAILAPHFVFFVKDLLSDRYPLSQIERGGLRVVTTLDPEKQKIAEEEIAKGVAANEKRYRATNAALVSVDVATGQIVALVGSRDYFDEEHDGNVNVAIAERNPGSSFKPIVYATAFAKGFTPETILYDVETNFGPDGSGKDYVPSDYDGKERGPVSMRQALAGSLNIPAVQTLYLATIPKVVEQANAFGYTTLKKPDEYGLALALGGAGVQLLEHTAAFGVIAREGVRLPTSAILRIEDANGKVLEQTKPPKGDPILEKNIARLITNIMSDNGARSFIFGSRSPLILPDRPVAAKTGTTNDWRDGWTIGFTPSLVTGVWAGNNDNSPMAKGADGVFVAAPIWRAFMQRALAGTPAEKFKAAKPNEAKNPALRGDMGGEETISIDRVTRRRIPNACLATWPAAFVDTVTVKSVHSTLHYVNKDDPNGPPPDDPAQDTMYARWERAVAKWAGKKYTNATPALESCDLHTPKNAPVVSLTQPADGATADPAGIAAAVTLTGPRKISQVEYLIDGIVVATVTVAPFSVHVPLAGQAAGFHTLTARATDDVGNTGTDAATLNLLSGSSQTIFFLDPSPGAQFAPDTALTIRGVAKDPAGVTAVVLLERHGETINEIGRTDSPASADVSFSLGVVTPGSHSYALRVIGAGGQSTTTDFLTITVGP